MPLILTNPKIGCCNENLDNQNIEYTVLMQQGAYYLYLSLKEYLFAP